MRDEVFNNEVGECLFNYFLDIKIPKGFNAQHNMPANTSFILCISKRKIYKNKSRNY